jgi:hypothetical protein
MSRYWITAAVAMTVVSCAEPGGVALTEADGRFAHASAAAACTAQQGQQQIDAGDYAKALREFTCLVDLDPTAVEGYRGRIEAELMLGRYSDAVRDYARVTAFVEPVHPDAMQTIIAGYAARLDAAPDAIPALTGLSFAYWWDFAYPAAMHVADQLLALRQDDVFANLFRGSSRVLQGTKRAAGVVDLDRAIALAPSSGDVHYVVADAYTYGSEADAQRAFDEATFALDRGLDTPRIRAILGASYLAFGDADAAAREIDIHIDQVTTALVPTTALGAASSRSLPLVPGRTYDIPLVLAAGESVSVATSSKDFWDTILVLLAPDGTPLVGSDDYKGYFAGLDWIAPAAGTYRLRVTSFEGVSTGVLLVARK